VPASNSALRAPLGALASWFRIVLAGRESEGRPPHYSSPNRLINTQRSRAAISQIDEPAVMRKPSIPEQAGQYGERLVCERLVHKGFLPLQRLNCAARLKLVLAVQFGIDELRE
jgi:hypothetical protein